MKVDVVTLAASKAGSVDLSADVFGLEPRRDILHRMVIYQLAKRQAGTHKAKERNEIRGTTKKSVRQKGSGGARHGNRKAPIFRGGGVAHGPRTRSHATKLNKKIRSLALRHALSAKQHSAELVILDDVRLETSRTKDLAMALKPLGLENALFVDMQLDENFKQAARNLPKVDFLPVVGANVYDILRCKKLVLTKAAVAGLEARLT